MVNGLNLNRKEETMVKEIWVVPKNELMNYNYSKQEKKKIIEYIKGNDKVAIAPGFERDYFTGEPTHVRHEFQSDGVYEWDIVLAYYVEKYNMKLPENFIKHILNN